MSSYCEGRVAVVTGAGGTLCSAIAKDLALNGAQVVLIGRTREKLEKVAESIFACNGQDARSPSVRVEQCDVTDEAAVRDVAHRVAAEWGPCRYLINGAGGNNVMAMTTRLRFSEKDLESPLFTNDNCHDCSQITSNKVAVASGSFGVSEKVAEIQNFKDSKTPSSESNINPVNLVNPVKKDALADRGFFDIDMEAFRSVLEINTLGTVVPSRIFGLQMAKAGGGAILNFASMNTYRPLTRVAPYAMSKAAIANWTMFFAQYMAPAKVRVNAVAPGFFVNERSRGYLMTPDGGLSPRGEQVMSHTPMGRFGEAGDLLGCVNWLLDDSVSSFVTGITVPVDGGFLSSAGV